MKNMHDCHETDESQTSQELAKLLASGRPDISENSQASDELSANHEAPDLAQPEHGSRRRFSLLGLGQGLPMSQTQNLSDDLEVEEEGSHSSQKENLHSSTDSSKLGPNPLCSSNENALSRSKKSTNKTLGVSSQSCLPNPIIPALQLTSSNSDPTSQTPESLQGFSAFVDCPGGSSDEPAGDISSRPSHRPNGASDSEMICSHFGASSPERLDSIRRALSKNPTPISNYVGSDSQGSDKASQVSGLGSQDDEPQAQVVPQFDMSELRELENEFYGDTQPQSQATQSTQPTATPDNDVKDDAWANFTGIQVPPHRRHRYLASAKEGAALQAVRNDTFYDGFDSSSSAPDNDEIFRQFPAGTPDPTCNSQQETQETQLVETQLVGNLQQEDEWVPPVQFPAGYGPAPEDEGAATQIVETQVATQIVDDSSPDEDTPVDTSPPVVPDPPPRASVIRVKSPMHSLETVPDSEPPSVVPDPPPRTSFIRVKSPIHSLETAPDSEPPSAISDPPPRTSFIRTKSPINSLEIVPDSEPPVPSPAHSLERSSVHVGTSQRRAIGTRTIIQPAEAQTQPTDIDEDDEDDKPLAAIVKSDRRKDADDPSAARKPPPPKRLIRTEGNRTQMAPCDNQDQEMTEMVPRTWTSSKRKANLGVEGEFSTKRRRKGGKVQATEPPARRRSTRPTRNRRSLAESESEEDGDDEDFHIKEEDAVTESGEESYMTPGPATTGETHPKRKRTVATSVPRKVLKKESGQTPANRTSHCRSTASVSAKKVNPLPLLRVLALYTDGYWYPGSVGDFQKPDNYKIVYDDNSAEWARTGSMRRLEVRVGDEVTNSKTNKSGTVKEVKDDMLVVSPSSGPNFDLSYRYLCIPCDKVEAQWEDRELTRTLLAGINDTSRQPALPEGADGFLRGCGIIITSNPTALAWNKEKIDIFASMIENGATLIEDWSDALQISGTYVYDKGKGKAKGKKGKDKDAGNRKPKSWKITKDQARWFEELDKGSIQRVFVLADTVCQKPKYLIALALGVPCLSTNWMTDSLQEREAKDWNRYLLPKGIDAPHNVRLSQSVNLDWGTVPEHLMNLMDNPYAHKVFAGKSVLCVGDDYIPEQHEERMGTNNYGELGFEALRTIRNRSNITSGVALIILAMGASQVTAVANFQDANKEEHFDFVVFKDPKWRSKHPTPKEGTKHASWAWAKQSLIRGQMLPVF